MAKPTIANVAELAGVSQATVSRALRGATNVTEETRIKVQRAADQLNFTLSKSASALASGKTMRVILLVSGKLNEWFNSGVLQGVYEELAPAGYDVTPAFITDRSELDRFFSQLPKSRNADAIIISSFQLMPAMRDQLQTIDLPTVGVNVPAESGYFDASISIDNSSAMTMAVQLLRSLGHTNIAFCSDYIPADMVYNTSQRTQAFADAAQANATDGITFSLLTADAHDAPLSKSDLASQLTAKLLSLPERPTAVCVETDQVAIALVKELRKQQLNVPEDISVLGFDDAEIAQAADLSTIRQKPIELGRIAGRKVLQLLRNEPLEHPHELQDPLLVLRNTTSRIDTGVASAVE